MTKVKKITAVIAAAAGVFVMLTGPSDIQLLNGAVLLAVGLLGYPSNE